ncbi:MAG: NAD(P)-dependent oxidoreductase [Proteobacteria bacterium]|nr:NAD(P)-dependent oxidoreductase [Pseudomonadota bacterium]
MSGDQRARDVATGRLAAEDYAANFADLHPPLTAHQAEVEADRCYFCHDAPCIVACPTAIDIPLFIRQIATGNPSGSGATIFKQNIMGGMCARVCPTEQLCEEACVRNTAEGKPVKIGLLQRHATDRLIGEGRQVFTRAESSGKHIAIVGAGPAGLACAHRLAVLGHEATVFEARPKPGGLNEYGIAAYKTVDGFAQAEIEYIIAIGGITIDYGKRLGDHVSLEQLIRNYHAVFLGLGMGAVNALGLDGEDIAGVGDAVDYIAELRQAKDLSSLEVGRAVVVIGGGMTAIDIADQSKRLGATHVTLVYRRGVERMAASAYEQELAKIDGVTIICNAQPHRLIDEAGEIAAVEFEYTKTDGNGRIMGTGEKFTVAADVLFKAIGQQYAPEGASGLTLDGGRIAVDEERRTSLAGVWAGGDCIAGGQDLTVAAVEDGKVAALSIDEKLRGD